MKRKRGKRGKKRFKLLNGVAKHILPLHKNKYHKKKNKIRKAKDLPIDFEGED